MTPDLPLDGQNDPPADHSDKSHVEPYDPHADQPLITGGAPALAAETAVILIHGRGGTARGTIRLADDFYRHGVTFIAPQAERSRWYPYSFDQPFSRNEPWLTSAVDRVEAARDTAREIGIDAERTVFVGISQGACVLAEYLLRRPARYGGAFIVSGGVTGQDPAARQFDGSLDGTPVFVGCSDDDPYVPIDRVRSTTAAFERLGGDVTERIYDGLGHGLNDDEIEAIGDRLDELG
ncbi:alpha/beta hydrolase [Natranaeroarchaeum aerophilus]|uniref:Phospholipase n=1 Tax=Natranaeroarchaeum aerophilus TaxID=2917711 RepID=A0AAE3K5V0_9EURY|nr:phospholipase [Natranaeroarchaeum aerophilus]MCL9814572.1 phospholipase [Natranaeroarchaeum aerophilus]